MGDLKKNSILYVDDEEPNLTVFAATFGSDYHVLTASTGRQGIEILKREPVQVIIVDQQMPEMTGIEFLEATIPEFPEIVRIILTGFSDVEDIIQAINKGRVFRYVTKPWNAQDLKINIEMAISAYNMEKQGKESINQLIRQLTDKESVLNLFKKHVPENILQKVVDEQGRAGSSVIEGETRTVAVLFVDICNFITLTARCNAQLVVSLLNDFFTMITAIVKKHKGNVNKFLGDNVLAVFGAPCSYSNNPQNAVYCALEVLAESRKFSEKWKDKIGEEIRVGIGITTGEVVIGDMRSDEGMEYSVVVDSVNLASQIQSFTKDRPNSILISEGTYQVMKELIKSDEIELHFKGDLNGQKKLYHLIGLKNA